jgi:hypothetical protein
VAKDLNDIIPFAGAVAEDVLAALKLPGGSTLSFIAERYVTKKRREAAEVLIEEISSGRHGPVNFEEEDIEPLIDMVLRFSKAVSDGAARENLTLLAQIIAGLKKKRAFDPDRFRRWAGVIEGLTRDQLLVLGLSVRVMRANVAKGGGSFNEDIRKALKEAGYPEGELEALLTSVSSTGLISSASAWGGLAYTPTLWMLELEELAGLEAVKRA